MLDTQSSLNRADDAAVLDRPVSTYREEIGISPGGWFVRAVCMVLVNLVVLATFIVLFFQWPFSETSLRQCAVESLAIIGFYAALYFIGRLSSRGPQSIELVAGQLVITGQVIQSGLSKVRVVPLAECHWYEGFTSNDWNSCYIQPRPAVCVVHRDLCGPNGRQCVACGLAPESRAAWQSIFRLAGIPQGRPRPVWELAAVVVSGTIAFALVQLVGVFANPLGIADPTTGFLVRIAAFSLAFSAAWLASIVCGNDSARFDRLAGIAYAAFPFMVALPFSATQFLGSYCSTAFIAALVSVACVAWFATRRPRIPTS